MPHDAPQVAVLERRLERLDAEVVDLRRSTADDIDARMAAYRKAWREELAAHSADTDRKLATLAQETDRKLTENRDAVISAMGATKGELLAKLEALAERRQVPAWFAQLDITPTKLVTYATALGIALTTILGAVAPFVTSFVASCQGHPMELRVPVPAPFQFDAGDDEK